MKYVLYHSGLKDHESILKKLRKHAHDGETVAEFHDSPLSPGEKPELSKALQKCRETGAMLVVLNLSEVGNSDATEKDGVKIKNLT